MIKPPTPANERQRLKALRDLQILDTAAEERFDRVTRLARRVFGTPIALVSLVDEGRQWFKSRVGLDATETPRDISFCGHAILTDKVMVVPDASKDERFHDNPLVCANPNIRFYAGYPLNAPDGSKIGTLCIIDQKPREIDDEDVHLLRELGRMVEEELVTMDMATTCPITEISNRRGFNELADHALALCGRVKSPATLVLFDLQTEALAEELGGDEAQRALVEFAQMLMVTFRDSDVVGRVGTHAFAALLVGAEGQNVDTALHRLRECLGQSNRAEGALYELEMSHRVVAFEPARHMSAEELLQQAEKYDTPKSPAGKPEATVSRAQLL